MKIKAFIISFIIVFIFIFIYDFVFHNIVLGEAYVQTRDLWRLESEMPRYFGWVLLGQALSAFVIVALIIRAAWSVKCGIGLGALLGLILTASIIIGYAVQPFPLNLILTWAVSAIVECALAGGIAAFIYFRLGGVGCSKPREKETEGLIS